MMSDSDSQRTFKEALNELEARMKEESERIEANEQYDGRLLPIIKDLKGELRRELAEREHLDGDESTKAAIALRDHLELVSLRLSELLARYSGGEELYMVDWERFAERLAEHFPLNADAPMAFAKEAGLNFVPTLLDIDCDDEDEDEEGAPPAPKRRRTHHASPVVAVATAERVELVGTTVTKANESGSGGASLEREMGVMRRELRKNADSKGRVSYLHFVTDPASFATTVENMFHLSFLLREKDVQLAEENAKEEGIGLPIIERISKAEKKKMEEGRGEYNFIQCIITLNRASFQQMVDELEIDEPLCKRAHK